jgi:hypothetical protein
MSTVVGSTVFAHDTTSVGGQLEHEHIVALSTVVFVFMNAILRFFRDRVFATVEEFRQATSIGAIDYAIFDLMCHGPSEQCGLPNVSAFTCAGCASRKEGVTVYAGVFKNNVLVLLEGNAPSNLGHELTTENTQMREEWSRRHGDIDVYEGATTDDALDSDIFHFACDLGLAPHLSCRRRHCRRPYHRVYHRVYHRPCRRVYHRPYHRVYHRPYHRVYNRPYHRVYHRPYHRVYHR